MQATALLNAVGEITRRAAAPAIGVLVLCELPYLLLLAHTIDILIRLRDQADGYGNLLTALATMQAAAFVLALYGRAVYMRACAEQPARWRDLLRVGSLRWITYVYVSLVIHLVMLTALVTVVAVPLLTVAAGVASSALADKPAPGLIAPFRALSRYFRHGGVLIAITLVFMAGFLVAAVNIAFLTQIILWAAGAIPNIDIVRWQAAASSGSARYVLAICSAAWLVIQPFWLAAMHLHGENIRARHSGDDLRRRFRELTTSRAAAASVVGIMILFCANPARAAQTISLETYAEQLTTLRAEYRAAQWQAVQVRTETLLNTEEVTTGETTFKPDRTLLTRIAGDARNERISPGVPRQLDATIAALSSLRSHRAAEPDATLLESIRTRQAVPELARGGRVASLDKSNSPLIAEIARLTALAIDWLFEKLEQLLDWLLSLRKTEGDEPAFFGFPLVVWLVTLLIVAAVVALAIFVIRRSQAAVARASANSVPSAVARDADPLSREANEWEIYARDLAASGRIREAIRAWYHAVLMTLYRAGLLHYRKGRTNWEYVRAISPQHEWRPRFVALTRLFEREWYGHEAGPDDALDVCSSDATAILDNVRGGSR